tara:strand:+ start:719 stop:1096 length:378 start_codon:yes stop_codon:yes gene_type:complete
VNLSESYKKRILHLSGILSESDVATKYEYQVRDIGGDSFYKRVKGEDEWSFTNELDFYKNSNSKNTVKWEKPEDPKGIKIRQIDINQDLSFAEHPTETYKRYIENICPSSFKVEIVDDYIKISKI